MRVLFTILCSVFFVCNVKAQVYPPDFKCVQNDTLRWDPFKNTCGAFQKYLIYGSQSFAGPYVQVGAVNNENTTFFFHLHPAGQTWYYFLQSRYDCPGQPILNSDTLTGSSPEIPVIRSISVENNKTVLEWKKTQDKRVYAYIIYKFTAQGIKPIDTVYNSNTYVDRNSQPDKQREIYFVLGLDRCGNTSLFGKAHQSIRVFYKQDECAGTALLNWNRYKDWSEGILRHEIWVKRGSLPYVMSDTLSGNDSSYVFKGLKDKEKYCFHIRSVSRGNPAAASRTNEVCMVADLINPLQFVIVKNVEISNKGETSFSWIWNNDADLDLVKIRKSADAQLWTDIATLPTSNFPGEVSYTDKTAGISEKTHYSIYTRDICGKEQIFPFYTLNIKGEVQDNRSNLLRWTTHFLPDAQKTDYELYRIVNGSENKIWESQNQNEFTDPFDPLNPENANICYYVVAYVYDTLPNGSPIRVRSKSNTVCVSQTATIFTPNAFAPRGVNQEFRPVISFNDQLASFSMVIFDRYGAKVFETDDLTVGWNGKLNNNGREMSQDTYVYYIKTVQKNGKTEETKGTVLLLR